MLRVLIRNCKANNDQKIGLKGLVGWVARWVCTGCGWVCLLVRLSGWVSCWVGFSILRQQTTTVVYGNSMVTAVTVGNRQQISNATQTMPDNVTITGCCCSLSSGVLAYCVLAFLCFFAAVCYCYYDCSAVVCCSVLI